MPVTLEPVLRTRPLEYEPDSAADSFRSPVVLFYAPPRGNLLHYLLDGALALFPTLDARHLLDNFPVLQQNMTDTDQVCLTTQSDHRIYNII